MSAVQQAIREQIKFHEHWSKEWSRIMLARAENGAGNDVVEASISADKHKFAAIVLKRLISQETT